MASTSDSISAVDSVDELYFSAIQSNNNNEEEENKETLKKLEIIISDGKYSEELQLQEALVFSLFSEGSSISFSREIFMMEKGESSNKKEGYYCFCEICVENKESEDMFRVDKCNHSFCSDCVTKHVTLKLQENVAVVSCLGLDCEGVLELEACRPKMPDDVAARWDEMLCESFIPAGEKFYCPFKDCSALLVRDTEGENVTQSECPYCHRLFCARCNVGWHAGFECEEILKLNEDEREREDLLVRELAKSNSWMRCPKCRFYVEKTEGCLHLTCRCKFQFCYACGATWTNDHGGCQSA